MAIDIHYRKE